MGPAQYLPAVAGFLLEKEVSTLSGLFSEPKRPFVAILGGSKVSDKIGVIDRLLDSADTVIVGGGMAYTFAKAQGGKIGNRCARTTGATARSRCSTRLRRTA